MLQIFQEYFNSKLVRFMEHDNKLYVDTDDLALLFEKPIQY